MPEYSISREFSFSYAHRLLDYPGKCRRLHGHNALLRVTLTTRELNPSGMVLDFYDLKARLGAWIEETLDHRVFLAEDDPLVDPLRGVGEEPLLFVGAPTSEQIAKRVFQAAQELGFPVTGVEFSETEKSRAFYQDRSSLENH